MAPDVRVINLETAITTSPTPWPGKGIHYRCHPANVATLAAAGIDVAVLSNNHVMDWGAMGLVQTLEALAASGEATAARRPALCPPPCWLRRVRLAAAAA